MYIHFNKVKSLGYLPVSIKLLVLEYYKITKELYALKYVHRLYSYTGKKSRTLITATQNHEYRQHTNNTEDR